MRGQSDGQKFENISATTSPFTLVGGAYALDAVATWGGGNVTLQRLGPDGATWINADATAISLTANGTSGAVALPGGSYRIAVTTATGVYASLNRCPGE